MTLYLSGPMRGYRNFNFDLFHEVAAALRARGHFIFNPAEHDENVYPNIRTWKGFESGDTALCPQFNLPHSLAWDFARILDSEGIALLPGWHLSTGAQAERFVAEVCAKRIFLAVPGLPHGEWKIGEDHATRIGMPTLREVA
jgi:hypothetical protein